MSFKDEVEAAAGHDMHGLTAQYFTDWASFWAAAAPLSRDMLVKHDALGNERLSPERDVVYYQGKFFPGDTYGLVLSNASGPVTGIILTRVAPDTMQQELRVGRRFPGTHLRRVHWDLGIRKLVFHVQYANTRGQRIAMMREQAREHNTVTVNERPDMGAGYKEYVIEFTSKPDLRDFDHSDPTPNAG